MNSFNTDDETQRIIQKYANHNVRPAFLWSWMDADVY